MTTAKDIFDIAMALMDEVSEANGATDTVDTKEYKLRTLLILNALRGELYPFSDTYAAAEPGKRPISVPISNFEMPIDLDDFLAQSVMPYGLAAQLLLTEDTASASFFQQRYEEMRAIYGARTPVASESIKDLYGGIG